MDGIQRQKSQHKHYGIFDCIQVSDHPMLKDISVTFRLPHSRWNGLPEAELTRCGYQVLTRAAGAGVDCFVKRDSSLFVYFQGHPEYEADTLLLEYRRDVSRYLKGESSAYPSMPQGYFNRETERELRKIQREAMSRPPKETLAHVASITTSIGKESGWGATASNFYKNWLGHMYARKSAQERRVHSATARCISPLSEPSPNMQGELIGRVAE
jgi:homoserine O-succinyltransferase